MHFQRILHIDLQIFIEYWQPAFSEIMISICDHLIGNRRKRIQQMPDGTTCEPYYSLYAQHLCSFSCLNNFGRSSFPYTFRFSIAPDMSRQDGFVSFIDQVTYRLSNQMCGDRMHLQFVRRKGSSSFITIIFGRLVYFKVVSPAGELKSIKAKFVGFFTYFHEGKIGPLAGKKGYRTCHYGMFRFKKKLFKVPCTNKKSNYIFAILHWSFRSFTAAGIVTFLSPFEPHSRLT